MGKAAVLTYAVVALTRGEVADVVAELKRRNEDELALWLEQVRDDGAYDDDPEQWKPFLGKTIKDLVETNGNVDYHSATRLINQIDPEDPNLAPIHAEGIAVFFIDLFACFSKKYKETFKMMDYALADGETSTCCFFGFHGLPAKFYRVLDEEYRKTWKVLSKQYLQGAPHRIAVRRDDVVNLRADLARHAEETIDPVTAAQMEKEYGRGKLPFGE